MYSSYLFSILVGKNTLCVLCMTLILLCFFSQKEFKLLVNPKYLIHLMITELGTHTTRKLSQITRLPLRLLSFIQFYHILHPKHFPNTFQFIKYTQLYFYNIYKKKKHVTINAFFKSFKINKSRTSTQGISFEQWTLAWALFFIKLRFLSSISLLEWQVVT